MMSRDMFGSPPSKYNLIKFLVLTLVNEVKLLPALPVCVHVCQDLHAVP